MAAPPVQPRSKWSTACNCGRFFFLKNNSIFFKTLELHNLDKSHFLNFCPLQANTAINVQKWVNVIKDELLCVHQFFAMARLANSQASRYCGPVVKRIYPVPGQRCGPGYDLGNWGRSRARPTKIEPHGHCLPLQRVQPCTLQSSTAKRPQNARGEVLLCWREWGTIRETTKGDG